MRASIWITFVCISASILFSCEPLATGFDAEENARIFEAKNKHSVADTFSRIKVMSWNIRFGIGRRPWFGDACGYRVVYDRSEIYETLDLILAKINELQPDVLLLQEVDIDSKRSDYVDELQWILDHSYFNYAAYGSQWKSQFIPSDGLGRMDEGNAILSRWPLADARRIALDLRNDQDQLTRYFYERPCIVSAQVIIPNTEKLYAVNIHASAFATDDTKYKHIQKFKEELDKLQTAAAWFVAGGDLNTLPPGSDTTDYCFQDACEGESFHHPNDNPLHKEGSNYTPEVEWLKELYRDYQVSVPTAEYLKNQTSYFTHTTRPEHFWDRTLDYLFTNDAWIPSSSATHQECLEHSDHAPVSCMLKLRKK